MASGPSVEERLRTALAHRYRIEGEIGSGGMATVYLAEDLKHHRKVAVKVLKPEVALALGAERFLREIEIAANLLHPHILPVFDSGEADGFLFYVMPRVTGGSLRDRLEEEGRLPVEEAVTIAREIADALAHAHERGVIHRDVKPANILLTGGHALLTDFGVAQAVAQAGEARLTQTGISLGTPAYMSPEQATGEGDLDGRSDQYALGCVLYELLAGRPPFTGPTGERVVRQHLTADAPDLREMRPGVPGPLAATVERALSKDPTERFATAVTFAGALRGEGDGWVGRPAPSARTVLRRVLGGVAGVVVVAILGALALHYFNGSLDLGPPSPDRPYTVLAAVDGSADPAIREAVEFLLRSALDVAHVVQTVPGTEVERVLTLMERPQDAPLDAATARELAERLGVSTVVRTRLDALGNGFLVAVRVEEAASGRLVAEARHQAPEADALVENVDVVSTELRRHLGETRAALANAEPLPQVFTRSLEALRKYREGVALFSNFQPGLAVPLFREALALDPEFSAAHVELSAAYHNAGIADSVVVHLRRALENPERLTDAQRRNTEAYLNYASDFALWDGSMFRTGDHNTDALRLTDFQYFDSAQAIMMSEVQEVVRRSRRFDPDSPLSTEDNNRWRNAIRLAIVTGRVEEMEAFRDSLRVEAGEYWELMRSFDASDWDRADSIRRSAPDIWGTHVNKRMAVTALEMVRGRVREGLEKWAVIPSRRLHPARVQLVIEVVYGGPGNDSAASLTDRGLDAVERYVAHGVGSAIRGDTAEAKRVARRLQAARDSATSELFEGAFQPMFALLDAGIATRRADWLEATRLLEPCADRLGEPGYGFISDRFLVRWMLAEAYARLGRTESSIRQLKALLKERSFEPLYVLVYAPVHLKLARLHSEMGDTAEAAAHYRTFLDTFTDPDPEYAWMVEEARAGLARLGG
jgi:tRNA A-37 threonylcarbamoyl transferase component Bud32/tetratricopeptide (TPR) repeat protein